MSTVSSPTVTPSVAKRQLILCNEKVLSSVRATVEWRSRPVGWLNSAAHLSQQPNCPINSQTRAPPDLSLPPPCRRRRALLNKHIKLALQARCELPGTAAENSKNGDEISLRREKV